MADNTILDGPGVGGDTIATDDIAGIKHQRVKVQYGDDGAATDVSDTNPLPIDDAGGSITVDGTVAVTQPVAVTDNAGSLTVDNAALSVVGGGTQATALRVTVASDSTGVLSVDDNGASLTVDVGTALPTGTNTVGDVGIKPRTTGGLSTFLTVDLDETDEDVKASAGQLFGWYLYNDGAAEVYVHLYNTTTPTVGTTTPILTLPIPAGAAANMVSEIGIAFSTAISAAATTAFNGTGAPAANQVIANFLFS